VDFEGGYSEDDVALADNVSRLLETGVIGINFEDRVVKGSGLYSVDRQARRIAAIRKSAERKGVDLFINARTDVFFEHGGDAAQAVGEALDRAKAYAAAGASGFFVPGLVDDTLIGRSCEGVMLPVNVMVMDGVDPALSNQPRRSFRLAEALSWGSPWGSSLTDPRLLRAAPGCCARRSAPRSPAISKIRSIVEVMLNPDGRLRIDRLAGGLEDTGCRVNPADAERIVRLVAHHVGVEVHGGSPRVSAELPESGERFEGLVPPVVAAPCFAIRRPAVAVFTLDDYVAAGIMSAGQADLLRRAVRDRKNVMVAGGTSTGKTTLVNALLAEIATTGDRIVLIEDTRELQYAAPNLVALRTKDGAASLSDLVRSSLRLRPDRIPIGEVRGAEALDLLKAWGTGHPGGVGTLHAGSAIGALRRLEQLIQEAVVTVPRVLIAETIDLIAVLAGRGAARRLADLAVVGDLGPNGDYVLVPAGEA
jgi:type IV secretion system protein TrbB